MLPHKNATTRTREEKGTKARIKFNFEAIQHCSSVIITDLRFTEVFSCYRSLSQCLGQQLSVALCWFQRQNKIIAGSA